MIEKHSITKEEALRIAEILDTWPKRMGCVLIPLKPGERGKNGYRTLEWGWRGTRFGEFSYAKLAIMLLEHKDAKLCPVTALGIMRGAQDFNDHMTAYLEIRRVVENQTGFDEKTSQTVYNFLLKHGPEKLAEMFRTYAREIK